MDNFITHLYLSLAAQEYRGGDGSRVVLNWMHCLARYLGFNQRFPVNYQSLPI